MKHPVVWFEVLGKDGPKLQRFYSELFGWQIKSDGASSATKNASSDAWSARRSSNASD